MMRVITGSARGTRLLTPEGQQTRPTTERTKEALFSAIQFEIEGRKVLDLFAGSGQLGIEALSRGAKQAVFVDADRTAVGLVRENLKRTKLSERAQVRQMDALSYLSACREQFGLIFLDPPYAADLLEQAMEKIYEFDILSSGGIIVAERPKGKVFSVSYPGYLRSKDYGFGQATVTLFRKE